MTTPPLPPPKLQMIRFFGPGVADDWVQVVQQAIDSNVLCVTLGSDGKCKDP